MNHDETQDTDIIEGWQLELQLNATMEAQQYELAVPLAERLLEIQDATLGPNHAKSVKTLGILTNGWMQLNQWERAEAFLLQRETRHPQHLLFLAAWASKAWMDDEVDAAEEIALRGLRFSREIEQAGSKEIATLHMILVEVYRKRKEWDEALVHAVGTFRQVAPLLTEEPLFVYKSLILTGEIFVQVEEYEQACDSAKLAVELTAGVLDSDPLRMGIALALYGRAALANKKPEGAVNPLKGALEFYEKLYGEWDERLVDVLVDLGRAYQAVEYYDEAEATFLRLRSLYARSSEDKTMLVIPLTCLAELETARGHHAKAAAYYEEGLALGEAEFGEDSLRLHVLIDKAAEAHLAAENFERTVELSRRHIHIMSPHLENENDPALLAPVRRLADIELRRLKDGTADQEELKRLLEWVTRLMQEATRRLEAENAELRARAKSKTAAS